MAGGAGDQPAAGPAWVRTGEGGAGGGDWGGGGVREKGDKGLSLSQDAGLLCVHGPMVEGAFSDMWPIEAAVHPPGTQEDKDVPLAEPGLRAEV